MSPIKKILFDLDWLEACILEYYNVSDQMFRSVSAFKKDAVMRKTAVRILYELSGETIGVISKRYGRANRFVFNALHEETNDDYEKIKNIIHKKSAAMVLAELQQIKTDK